MRQLKHKRVLITGAGHGLGRELSRHFAAQGSEVIVTDRNADQASETVEEIRRAQGLATALQLDVTDADSVRDAHEHLRQRPLDVLINNAGIVHGGALVQVPLEQHQQTLRVNTEGLLIVTREFLPGLIARPEAHVVVVASAAGLLPLPFAISYAASKWAAVGFAESLREELRLQGNRHVSVTTVCPSYISTGLFQGAKPPRFCSVLSPECVARQVVRAVQRDRESVLTPWFVHLTPMARVLLPRAFARRLSSWLGVDTSMVDWRGHDPLALAEEPAGA